MSRNKKKKQWKRPKNRQFSEQEVQEARRGLAKAHRRIEMFGRRKNKPAFEAGQAVSIDE